MRRGWTGWAAAALAAALFLGGVVRLFQRQFAAGELYPEYSSLRTDRMGAKLLYDSLAKLPGVAVERNFLPLDFLPRDAASLLLLGVTPGKLDDPTLLRSLSTIAGRGDRVVVALRLPDENGDEKPSKQPTVRELWKVSIQIDRDAKAPHRLYFGPSEGWRVVEQAGDRPLAIEREFGKGTVVLMAESGWFTNATAVAVERLPEVVKAVGPYRRIIFDEQHLGLAESGSVVGMARQFRLMGLAAGLALCALLFIWRNASAFPPPPAGRAVERYSGRTSQAGLLTLLKRHIPAADLPAVCWQEWLSANGGRATPQMKASAAAILKSAAARPVDAMREIQALLAKGRL